MIAFLPEEQRGIQLNDFFRELKRRNVFKVGVAYVVVGWAILQFVDIVQDPMALPDWFPRVTIERR